MIKCPICKIGTGYYSSPGSLRGILRKVPYPLWQYNYPEEPDYISPRCTRCFDKAMEKKEVEDAG